MVFLVFSDHMVGAGSTACQQKNYTYSPTSKATVYIHWELQTAIHEGLCDHCCVCMQGLWTFQKHKFYRQVKGNLLANQDLVLSLFCTESVFKLIQYITSTTRFCFNVVKKKQNQVKELLWNWSHNKNRLCLLFFLASESGANQIYIWTTTLVGFLATWRSCQNRIQPQLWRRHRIGPFSLSAVGSGG